MQHEITELCSYRARAKPNTTSLKISQSEAISVGKVGFVPISLLESVSPRCDKALKYVYIERKRKAKATLFSGFSRNSLFLFILSGDSDHQKIFAFVFAWCKCTLRLCSYRAKTKAILFQK